MVVLMGTSMVEPMAVPREALKAARTGQKLVPQKVELSAHSKDERSVAQKDVYSADLMVPSLVDSMADVLAAMKEYSSVAKKAVRKGTSSAAETDLPMEWSSAGESADTMVV